MKCFTCAPAQSYLSETSPADIDIGQLRRRCKCRKLSRPAMRSPLWCHHEASLPVDDWERSYSWLQDVCSIGTSCTSKAGSLAVSFYHQAHDLCREHGMRWCLWVRMALQAAKELGVAVRGVSFHVGSGATDPEAFRKAIQLARDAFDVGSGRHLCFCNCRFSTLVLIPLLGPPRLPAVSYCGFDYNSARVHLKLQSAATRRLGRAQKDPLIQIVCLLCRAGIPHGPSGHRRRLLQRGWLRGRRHCCGQLCSGRALSCIPGRPDHC